MKRYFHIALIVVFTTLVLLFKVQNIDNVTVSLLTWSVTLPLSLLLIGFICYALPLSVFAALPASEGNQPVLRIQGSNTIGAKLGPELVKGLFEAQGLHDIHSEEGARENEQRLLARRADGRDDRRNAEEHGQIGRAVAGSAVVGKERPGDEKGDHGQAAQQLGRANDHWVRWLAM